MGREEINNHFLPEQMKFYVYLDEDCLGELVFVSKIKFDRESGEVEADGTISIHSAMKLQSGDPRIDIIEKYAPYLVRYEVTANLDFRVEESHDWKI